MAIQGLRDTSDFVTDERPKNWREGILLLYPNGKMPLTALSSMMKKRSVDDAEFNWWEKELSNRRFALTANLTLVNTDLTMASGAFAFKEGDVLLVEESEEILFVTADPSVDTSLVVSRGFAGSVAATLDFDGAGVNPNVVAIGSAYEEGSLDPTGVNYTPTKVYNYTQIFRNTLEITRTASKTRLRTKDAVREAKRECLEYHGIDMERSMWLGKKTESARNGQPQRTMDGVFNFIHADNVKNAVSDYAGGVTMSGLEEYLYEAFKFGSSEKMGFCGNRALLTLQQIARKNSTIELIQGQKEFGMNVSRFISPFGEIVLKSHPLWNQMTGGVTTAVAYYGMESWLAIMDMAEFTYVHLKDSDTTYEPSLQANGMDGLKSGYISEASIEVHHPKTHYLIKDLIGSAAG